MMYHHTPNDYFLATLEEMDNCRSMYEHATDLGVTPEVTAREQDGHEVYDCTILDDDVSIFSVGYPSESEALENALIQYRQTKETA